jgi:RecA-family ATPase
MSDFDDRMREAGPEAVKADIEAAVYPIIWADELDELGEVRKPFGPLELAKQLRDKRIAVGGPVRPPATAGDPLDDIDFDLAADEARRALSERCGNDWELPLIDTTQWVGKTPPPRRYIVDGWLARSTGAGLFGDAGVGKSLIAQQLVTCAENGVPFLGLPVTKCRSLYLTCEDDTLSLWQRQRAINRSLGVDLDFAPMLSTLVGCVEADLGAFNDAGRFVAGKLFHAIMAVAKRDNIGLIVLDNIAHLFPGNEIVRRQVVAFLACIDQLAIECDAAVLLLGHPAKTEGSEYSGSTGWSAHVRQRWFLGHDDESNGDDDARILRKSKANLSKAGEEIRCRWHEWSFVRPNDLPDNYRQELAETTKAARENAVFLDCLRERDLQGDGRHVGPSPGPNYAPTQFVKMPLAKGLKKERLALAMERLFTIGAIESYTHRNTAKSRDVTAIREVPNAFPNASRSLIPNSPEQSARTVPHTHSISKDIDGAATRATAPIEDDDPDDPAITLLGPT